MKNRRVIVMKKKTVSIMVAATMALSLFAGCGRLYIKFVVYPKLLKYLYLRTIIYFDKIFGGSINGEKY